MKVYPREESQKRQRGGVTTGCDMVVRCRLPWMFCSGKCLIFYASYTSAFILIIGRWGTFCNSEGNEAYGGMEDGVSGGKKKTNASVETKVNGNYGKMSLGIMESQLPHYDTGGSRHEQLTPKTIAYISKYNNSMQNISGHGASNMLAAKYRTYHEVPEIQRTGFLVSEKVREINVANRPITQLESKNKTYIPKYTWEDLKNTITNFSDRIDLSTNIFRITGVSSVDELVGNSGTSGIFFNMESIIRRELQDATEGVRVYYLNS